MKVVIIISLKSRTIDLSIVLACDLSSTLKTIGFTFFFFYMFNIIGL